MIFDSNCTSCHGNSGGLDLTSYSSLMAGGNNGAVIVPNDHQSSILWQQISLGSMPPNGSLESSKIRSATGITVNWLTIIGPLNFSYSIPITKEDTDQTESFRFRIGTSF
mgnify:CR=1 FL=1